MLAQPKQPDERASESCATPRVQVLPTLHDTNYARVDKARAG